MPIHTDTTTYTSTPFYYNGAKLEIVSKILGHSSVAITAAVYRTA